MHVMHTLITAALNAADRSINRKRQLCKNCAIVERACEDTSPGPRNLPRLRCKLLLSVVFRGR